MGIDFYANWCGPCRRLAPMLERMAQHDADQIRFVKVNTDDEAVLTEQFNVTNLPTLVFLDEGQVAFQLTGLMAEEQLQDKLTQWLARRDPARPQSHSRKNLSEISARFAASVEVFRGRHWYNRQPIPNRRLNKTCTQNSGFIGISPLFLRQFDAWLRTLCKSEGKTLFSPTKIGLDNVWIVKEHYVFSMG